MKTVVTKTGLQKIVIPLPVHGSPGKCPYKVLPVGWKVFARLPIKLLLSLLRQ